MRETERMCPRPEEIQLIRRSFEEAMDRLASKPDRPTVEEIEEVFRIGGALPILNFSTRFDVERERNTERYREAAQEAERAVSTSD